MMGGLASHTYTYPSSERELLQAILDELRRLNQVAYCPETQTIPRILKRIEEKLDGKRKKKNV